MDKWTFDEFSQLYSVIEEEKGKVKGLLMAVDAIKQDIKEIRKVLPDTNPQNTATLRKKE